jgi:hypothetical protein
MEFMRVYFIPARNSLLIIFVSVNGQQIKMTEDHKIANYSERLRIEGTGEPLKEGETRLYGMKEEKSLKQNFPALYNFEIAIC